MTGKRLPKKGKPEKPDFESRVSWVLGQMGFKYPDMTREFAEEVVRKHDAAREEK